MRTFEDVRGQLGMKVCLGSQGNVLTEQVMQLIDEAVREERDNAQTVVIKAYTEGFNAGLNEPRITQVGKVVPFEALEKVANECMEGVSKPAKAAILNLMAEVSALAEA